MKASSVLVETSEIIQGSKFHWRVPVVDKAHTLPLAARYNLSEPLCQTLLTRGFCDKEIIEQYLSIDSTYDIACPSLLKDGQKAINRIMAAIEKNEKILIFGDYDVDGITSSSLALACLLPLKAKVNFYLPHRVKDGYGLSSTVVQRAFDNGYSLIITVDNGISAFEPVLCANRLGIDVIITDHHRPHGAVPEAYAIVNPHQEQCLYPYKEFAGVGVCFKLMSLLYKQYSLEMPEKAYELLLLGTVADVVPLTGENRFWVRYGLKKMNEMPSFSFEVLKMNGAVTNPLVSSTDIGFRIAPQINALGRLEDPRQGVTFLLGSDEEQTVRVGALLSELNAKRKDIERAIFEEVQALVVNGTIDLEKEYVIVVGSKGWPAGVIGLVASRLVAEYGRPVILLHVTEKGIAKGSCRSIKQFNMFKALEQCADLLLSFGGHPMAAGLSLPLEKVSTLKDRLEEIARMFLTKDDFQRYLTLDASITMSDVGTKLIHDLSYFEPFGAENSVPSFYLRSISLIQPPQLLKDVHVKAKIFSEGVIKPIVFFNRPDLYEALLAQKDEPFDVAVQVTQNHWQGKMNVELLGLDCAGLIYKG